jgi:hypothetical protein
MFGLAKGHSSDVGKGILLVVRCVNSSCVCGLFCGQLKII